MEETINDRIEKLVNEQFDGNKAAFEKAMGFPKSCMSSYIGRQRRSRPSVDMVNTIIKVLNVDARWLLMGDAPEEVRHVGEPAAKEDAADRIRLLEALVAEKDERIAELKERIEELKAK